MSILVHLGWLTPSYHEGEVQDLQSIVAFVFDLFAFVFDLFCLLPLLNWRTASHVCRMLHVFDPREVRDSDHGRNGSSDFVPCMKSADSSLHNMVQPSEINYDKVERNSDTLELIFQSLTPTSAAEATGTVIQFQKLQALPSLVLYWKYSLYHLPALNQIHTFCWWKMQCSMLQSCALT